MTQELAKITVEVQAKGLAQQSLERQEQPFAVLKPQLGAGIPGEGFDFELERECGQQGFAERGAWMFPFDAEAGACRSSSRSFEIVSLGQSHYGATGIKRNMRSRGLHYKTRAFVHHYRGHKPAH